MPSKKQTKSPCYDDDLHKDLYKDFYSNVANFTALATIAFLTTSTTTFTTMRTMTSITAWTATCTSACATTFPQQDRNSASQATQRRQRDEDSATKTTQRGHRDKDNARTQHNQRNFEGFFAMISCGSCDFEDWSETGTLTSSRQYPIMPKESAYFTTHSAFS